MTMKEKYDYALIRLFDLHKLCVKRESELEKELAGAKADLHHMTECYLSARNEISQLREDLYHEIGSAGG